MFLAAVLLGFLTGTVASDRARRRGPSGARAHPRIQKDGGLWVAYLYVLIGAGGLAEWSMSVLTLGAGMASIRSTSSTE